MNPNTHYTPTASGFSISGSQEVFNRFLYGSHTHDDRPERFFTFAGDTPQFMGAICDWTKNLVANQEKSGVLRSGLAITPGRRAQFYYSKDIDQTSRWFHDSEDILAEFRSGWMEYELAQMSSWFPDVGVMNIEAYPLLPDDGFLIHYRISTDQRVHFTAGFGGMTEIIGRFEYSGESRRVFSPQDAAGNRVEIGKDRACITHPNGTSTMRIAASFPAEFSLGSAKAMADLYPSTFMAADPENDDDQVVRITAPILPGETLDGFLVAVRNSDDATLDKWLNMEDPIGYIKQQILAKFSCIDVTTPDQPLDLTIAPTVIAMDASWHKDAFYHGAVSYHAPFLGWRNWYAPTVLGWGDRVAKTMQMWLSHITKGDVSKEKVWYDFDTVPKTLFDSNSRFHKQDNPVGRLPAYFNPKDNTPCYGPYNMQECALDMMLYYLEWSGDMNLAEKCYDDMCSMAEWERRTFDPDNDGLYQSLLNTWISDGHCYNGAGCAQSSAYNYRANLVLSKIAEKIGRDGSYFAKQAEKIKKALNEKLWVPSKGIIAESLDTIGNRLMHTAVELATVYHVMDSDMIDDFRAYCTLRYTERHLKSIVTPGRGGRLCYSSNWLPKQYSQCGIFPAENAHLALMYFKLGLKEEAMEILKGIADCYFTGKNPGMAPHIQSVRGTSDFGDQDFSDVSSTYLRLVVEGLFGVRVNHLDNVVTIAPGFPEDWDHASLTLKDIDLVYTRKGEQEIFTVRCDKEETKRLRIPMRSGSVDAVLLDGEPVDYTVAPGPNCSFLFVQTDKVGRFQLRVLHGSRALPTVSAPASVLAGNRLVFEVKGGQLTEVHDVNEVLEDITVVGSKVYATAKAVAGDHTLFLHVVSGQYDTWLAADYDIVCEETAEEPLEEKPFEPVEMSSLFNCNMTEVHTQRYLTPRPEGFSMTLAQNARYAHNWNQYGRGTAHIDDTFFRTSGGTVTSPSGIPFATPAEKENLACVSMYDNFPTSIRVPLSGKGQEVAILLMTSIYPMQAYVENARITVTYKDGTTTETSLVYPLHVDDWLTSALVTEAEIFYFNDWNHGTVQRLRLDPTKELADIKIEAISNECIFGVAGISISR